MNISRWTWMSFKMIVLMVVGITQADHECLSPNIIPKGALSCPSVVKSYPGCPKRPPQKFCDIEEQFTFNGGACGQPSQIYWARLHGKDDNNMIPENTDVMISNTQPAFFEKRRQINEGLIVDRLSNVAIYYDYNQRTYFSTNIRFKLWFYYQKDDKNYYQYSDLQQIKVNPIYSYPIKRDVTQIFDPSLEQPYMVISNSYKYFFQVCAEEESVRCSIVNHSPNQDLEMDDTYPYQIRAYSNIDDGFSKTVTINCVGPNGVDVNHDWTYTQLEKPFMYPFAYNIILNFITTLQLSWCPFMGSWGTFWYNDGGEMIEACMNVGIQGGVVEYVDELYPTRKNKY